MTATVVKRAISQEEGNITNMSRTSTHATRNAKDTATPFWAESAILRRSTSATHQRRDGTISLQDVLRLLPHLTHKAEAQNTRGRCCYTAEYGQKEGLTIVFVEIKWQTTVVRRRCPQYCNINVNKNNCHSGIGMQLCWRTRSIIKLLHAWMFPIVLFYRYINLNEVQNYQQM